MNKRFKAIICSVCLLAAFLMTGCGNSNSNAIECGGPLNVTHNVEITVTGFGTIKAELYGEVAPITVNNFVSLANEGFYDGLTFMRIIDGFMIQGGDPNKDCTGGSSKTIKGEFSSNGITNNISHTRGVLSMARSNNPNSASSQFFIMVADATYLDGNYAAFGCVTEGMDVVDEIVKQCAPIGNSNGVITDTSKQPIIESIKITQ